MSTQQLFFAGLLSVLPISELRGAIPYALAHGMSALAAYFYCVILNALVGPFVYGFLSSINKLFLKAGWYQKLFDRIVERARTKVHAKVERFGYWGVMLFVAIPLPVTGAYTGALGAWILGLNARKTFLAVLGGVVIAGIVVTIISYFGIAALAFFVKNGAAQ